MDPPEVSSTYEYTYCQGLGVDSEGNSACVIYAVADVAVAPLIPPYSYNNLCSSIMLTGFIPVYIFVYAVNMLVPLWYVCVFTSVPYTSLPPWLLNGGMPGYSVLAC